MNASSSIVHTQVERLLDVVQRYQQQQCDKIVTRATAEAEQMIHQTYRDVRLRLHQEILDSRDRLQGKISASKAKSHTLRKKYQHEADRRYLDRAWDLLKVKLIERWQNKEYRQRWVQKHLVEALRLLIGPEWLVEHPHSWTVDEQQHFIHQVRDKCEVVVNFSASPDIVAGVRICANGATIDGTLQGLLADRSRIESELLAQYHQYILCGSGS
ncbi:MAG: hypothetical protein AB4040_19225 [Synechococcus sp.]